VPIPGTVPGNQARVLAFAGRQPLLVSSNYGKGRTFHSFLPAVLFNHGSDHIQHMAPDEWARILKGVQAGLAPYRPSAATPDFLSQDLRALRTSKHAMMRRHGWGHYSLRVTQTWPPSSTFSTCPQKIPLPASGKPRPSMAS